MAESISRGYRRPDAGPREDQDRGSERLPSEAYAKAARILEEGDVIDPTTFKRFDQALIRADQEKVAQRKAEQRAQETDRDREIKRNSDTFEAIFTEQAELSDWLGTDTMIRKASEYDGLVHGIESIADCSPEEGSKFLALGIDVTSSEVQIRKKLAGIKRSIDNGRLEEVRYFQSFFPDGNLRFEGSLFNVPLAVIAIDRTTIAELARFWVKPDPKALARHSVQYLILDQLELQMEAFVEYAKRTHRKHLLAPLTEVLERVRGIKRAKQKPGTTNASSATNDHPMIKALKAELRDMFGGKEEAMAGGSSSVMRRVA